MRNITSVFSTMFYMVKTGCQWRMLPGNVPPWPTVYWYFRKWTDDATLELVHAKLSRKTRGEPAGKESCTTRQKVIFSQVQDEH